MAFPGEPPDGSSIREIKVLKNAIAKSVKTGMMDKETALSENEHDRNHA